MIIKRILLPVMLCLLHHLAFAQAEGNVWAFGKSAGLDFNSGSPVPINTNIGGYGEACASICSKTGQLLFYTEGTRVWDRNGNIMPNANDLTGLPYVINLHPPTSSTAQGALIIPMPDSAGKYYVFSLSSQFAEMGANAGKLYYSIVNMTLNGGLGDVEPGRKGILIDSQLTEKMTAVVGDRCNIWLLVHKLNTTTFKAYEITPAGIDLTPVLSNAGSMTTLYVGGTMKISPNRKKLVCGNAYTVLFTALGGLELFDFDAATGIVSNGITLDNLPHYGACFSPNNSLLYVSRYVNGDIYQYDITLGSATAISNSKKWLGQAGFTDLKLAPDGKIYLGGIANAPAITKLSTINLPDNPGLTCMFLPNSVNLSPGTSFFAGLPNEAPVFIRDTVITSRNIKVCFKDSIQLLADTAATGWDHTWLNGKTGRIVTVDTSGDYVAEYHTAPCTLHRDTFRVFFASPIPLTGTFAGCKGETNSFLWVQPRTGDTNTYMYTWTDSAGTIKGTRVSSHGDTLYTTPGRYTVNLSAPNGCDTTIALRLLPPDYEVSFITDSVICIGDALALNNTSHGFNSYSWYFGNGDSSIQNNPVYIYPSPGNYTVWLVGHPCNDSVNRSVTIDSIYNFRFITDDTAICAGSAAVFHPDYPVSTTTLHWSFGDGTETNSFAPMHAYDTAGLWIVQLTASFRACPNTVFSDTIHSYPHPIVDLGPDTSLCLNGAPVSLFDHVTQPTGYSYIWNTGNVTNAITARHPAIYTLAVTSDKGCVGSDSVEVFKNCYIDIPNAFTPNGDGNNDYFLPRQLLSKSLTHFHMQIFNRWGQLIFETTRTNGRGWDGELNDKEQPAGVYVYLIEATIGAEHKERYQGNVTLLR